MKIRPEDNQLTPEQRLHRHKAFNHWLAKNGDRIGFYALPVSTQYDAHRMLRRAFNAGTNYEARMAILEAENET